VREGGKRADNKDHSASRESLVDVQVGTTIIPRGDKVTVLLGSANHDEEHFPDPDSLNLRRSGPHLLSFGRGIHTCLGAALARMEAQIAFTELALRFPSCRLVSLPERTQSVTFRGLQSLVIQL
jgi:cytochrome P450